MEANLSNKSYYWLRLKEDFFGSRAMKKLRKIAGGDTYTIIYLKLQLLSLKEEGYLFYEHIEDNFSDEMALALEEDEENVKVTLNYLMGVGLLNKVNEDTFFLPEVPLLIGKETNKAQSMRTLRENRKKELLEKGNNVTQMLPPVTNCYTEIDIEKDIDIDIEKEKDIELEKNTISAKASKKPPKHKHGEFQHVLLTDDELNRLFDDYGESDVEAGIKYLDEYIEMKGAKYKNHNLVLRKWGIDGAKKKKPDTESDFERKWRSALDD